MTARRAASAKKRTNDTSPSPYGYPYWEWVAREDPEYVAARQPLSELSIGVGKELSIKYREMVIIGILAFIRAARRPRNREGLLHVVASPRRSVDGFAGT